MNLPAAFANSLWAASCVPAWTRFRRALREPGVAQRALLQRQLRRNADSAFGRAHGFAGINNYEEFARRVPLADYDAFAPWIERIRRGEPKVLTREAVTHLIPTSGTTSGRKLIPFTADLQREFNAAIGPWLVDLARRHPGVLGGAAYWSVSPALQPAAREESAVLIGFDSDAAYLGGGRRRLVDAVLAVPAEVRRITALEPWRYATLLGLLRRRELRFVSIWNPSFLTLLLGALPEFWNDLLRDVADGTCRHGAEFPADSRTRGRAAPQRARAAELARLDPRAPAGLWPELRVISCWGDAAAALALPELRRQFPNVPVQTKGLLATEAFVSLPFAGRHPLAVTSHFCEFLDDAGRVHLAADLRVGAEYEVVVTTGGGLWRYRLGDRVRVTGRVGRTPTVEFLGRAGKVSDLFGEKLSEAFVVEVVREMFVAVGAAPRPGQLAPERDAAGWRYVLRVGGEPGAGWAEALEHGLRRNPQYAGCRDLGQLHAPRVVGGGGAPGTLPAWERVRPGVPLGARKPDVLGVAANFRGEAAGDKV